MSEHTPGPWVGFSDQGKVVAIMPAGREGDICTFQQPPSDADARLMIAAPALVKALEEIIKIDRTKVLVDGVQIRDEDAFCARIARAALRVAVGGSREP